MQAVGLLRIGWFSSPCPVLAVWTLCHDARLAAVLVLRSPSLQVPSACRRWYRLCWSGMHTDMFTRSQDGHVTRMTQLAP